MNYRKVVKDIQSRKNITAIFALSLVSMMPSHAQIAAWDFFGESSPAISSADVYDTNLDSSSTVTRGQGATASSGSNSFRTTGFQNNGISTTNTDFFQISLSSDPGQSMSLTTIDARFAGTTSFAATPGVSSQFAYSLDGITFTLIGSPVVTAGTPATLPQISLAGIPALQNVPAGTTVTLRYYASGQTTTGGWGFNSPSAGQYGLAIGGTFAPDGGSPPDTTAPSFTVLFPADNATNVNLTADLVVTFDETVQAGTGNITIKKTSDNSDVEVIPVTDSKVTITGNTVTINPAATLDFATEYYVLIASGAIKDNATTPNNFAGISDTTAWSFTTRSAPVAGLVISEVYGGGGNTGAPFTNDFVELYNATSSEINLVGYSIQYASATGTFNAGGKLDLTGSIPAGAYYLIQLAGGTSGSALPTPNISSGTINMAGAAGKVALLNTTTLLGAGGPTDPSVVDYVGYGLTASAFEGTGATPAPSNTSSVSRNASNADTNDNAADFAVTTPPTPQNTTGGVDTAAPTVNIFSPADNSTTASITQNLVITFSEPVVKGTGDIVIYNGLDNSVFATIPVSDASVSISANVVTINPSTDFASETSYYVNIAATAFTDAAANAYAGIANATTWNFTTEAPVVPGTLAAGDIAFVGFTPSSDDHLAFVALKAIPAGEVIRFTDNEWNGSPIGNGGAWTDSNEGFISWTSPEGGVPQGTVVRLDNLSAAGRSASIGTVSIASSFNLGATAETVYAFQGSTLAPTAFLAVIASTTADSIAGTGLSSLHTVYLTASSDHFQYSGSRNGQATFADYLTLITNTTTNWVSIAQAEDPATTFTMTPFSIGTSAFSTWASANGATNDPLADHDNDGVKNGVEYFMGQTGSTYTTMPSVVDGAVTWPKDPTANATYIVKTSVNLIDWSPASGVVDNGTSVTFTLPTGQNKIFVRLEVTIP